MFFRLTKLHRRIFIANLAIKYFLTHEWQIHNEHFLNLDNFIKPADKADWSFEFRDIEIGEYLRNAFNGAKQYLIKDDISTLGLLEARKRYNR